ncbi:UDP-N-acetyl-alpha-D-glucosamine C6 dehydratase [compost metagenome]
MTHPEMTRYFMTIPEAAQLVIQAGSMGESGDVFVLDMGEPVKIAQMAEKMVHLSGLTVRSEANPDGDIDIEFSGLRPGEKLYEELLIGDNVLPTEHPMIMRANEVHMPWEELKELMTEMVQAIRVDDYPHVRALLCQIVSGYTPDANVDWLHWQVDVAQPVAPVERNEVVAGANRS